MTVLTEWSLYTVKRNKEILILVCSVIKMILCTALQIAFTGVTAALRLLGTEVCYVL